MVYLYECIINHDDSSFLDIDECKTVASSCSANEYCRNKDGSYECPCVDGFEKDTSGNCVG